MQKILIPAIAALALSSAAAGALIISSAHAKVQPDQAPTMIQPTDTRLAQAATPPPVQRATRAGAQERRAGPDRAARMTQFCADGYARAVGDMAYLEARLTLTPSETPLFDRWKTVKLDQAKSRQSACEARQKSFTTADRPARNGPPSPVDRMTREETMFKQRLAAIDSERPALTALYNALTPEQKQAFDRQGHRPMMMARMRGRGMMGRGERDPMGPGPRGPMPDAPPPG